MNSRSQNGVLLQYLQNNKHKEVLATDFQFYSYGWFIRRPLIFIGSKPGSRLSQLLKLGLVQKVGQKRGVAQFIRKAKNQDYYRITLKGLNYKLK